MKTALAALAALAAATLAAAFGCSGIAHAQGIDLAADMLEPDDSGVAPPPPHRYYQRHGYDESPGDDVDPRFYEHHGYYEPAPMPPEDVGPPGPRYGGPPDYVAPGPPAYGAPPPCSWSRDEPVWDGYQWVRRRVQVCE